MSTFIEAKERAEQDGSEWKFGAVETDLALVPVKDRMLYTPAGVLQYNNVFDTNGCASRGPNNILETKLTWLYHNGMPEKIKKWLKDNGYVQLENYREVIKVNDAYIEILSGTTPTGNSLKAPVDAIYRYGAIPAHHLPLEDGMTREQYMDKNRIKPWHLNLGQAFLKLIGINYEQVPVSQFLQALEDDLLDVAGHGWPTPVNDVYPRTDNPFNHAFATVDPLIRALDNYEPFTKQLAPDYKFFEWGYSLSITRLTPPDQEVISLYQQLIAKLRQIIAILKR